MLKVEGTLQVSSEPFFGWPATKVRLKPTRRSTLFVGSVVQYCSLTTRSSFVGSLNEAIKDVTVDDRI